MTIFWPWRETSDGRLFRCCHTEQANSANADSAHSRRQEVGAFTTAFDSDAAYWTEHSDRNWLNSLLAAIGVSPQERNYVGRWQVGASVDEYMRTAKRVIFGLQERLISHFLQSEDLALRSAGLEELESPLLLREVSKVAASGQIEKLRVPRHWQPVVPAPEKVEALRRGA